MLSALAASLCAAMSGVGLAAEFKCPELNFAVTTDDSWTVADEATLRLVNQMTSQSAVAHARRKSASAAANTVDSEILLLHSKLPLGSLGDNPNLILAKEKAWTEEFAKKGAGYLKLMQERVALFGAPTKFIGKAKVVKVGDTRFHQMDAINTKIPAVETKQRYLCTFKDGYYIYFVLSLNDEDDADYAKMIEVVRSFRVPKRE